MTTSCCKKWGRRCKSWRSWVARKYRYSSSTVNKKSTPTSCHEGIEVDEDGGRWKICLVIQPSFHVYLCRMPWTRTRECILALLSWRTILIMIVTVTLRRLERLLTLLRGPSTLTAVETGVLSIYIFFIFFTEFTFTGIYITNTSKRFVNLVRSSS